MRTARPAFLRVCWDSVAESFSALAISRSSLRCDGDPVRIIDKGGDLVTVVCGEINGVPYEANYYRAEESWSRI
jgi:hypothetical protein